MSLNMCFRLFFPMASATDVLEGLSGFMLADGEHALPVAAPDGQVVIISPADPRSENPKRAEAVDFTSSPSFIGVVTYTVRKKKRTSRPRINKWGEEEFFKVVKTTEARAANVSIGCGRDYFELTFSNLTNDLGFFEASAVFSKLAQLYEEARGVVAVNVEMMEHWRVFSQLGNEDSPEEIDIPNGFDENEQGIDGLVEMLVELIGGGSTRSA